MKKRKDKDDERIVAALDALDESIVLLKDYGEKYDSYIDATAARGNEDRVKKLIAQKLGVCALADRLAELKENLLFGSYTSQTIDRISALPGAIADCMGMLAVTRNVAKIGGDIMHLNNDVQRPIDGIAKLNEVVGGIVPQNGAAVDENSERFAAEYAAVVARRKGAEVINTAYAGADAQGHGAGIFDANKAAVVKITIKTPVKKVNGTGFIISDKGYLLTNEHVVFDKKNNAFYTDIEMSLLGEDDSRKIEVLYTDSAADVALCGFDPSGAAGLSTVKPIADYSELKQGADCYVIGNGFGMGLAPVTGTVRFTKNRDGDLVYTVPSNPGDSGAPVFNRNGECIGMNKSRTLAVNGELADGYANATPMDTIRALLDKWNITL